MDTIDWTIEPLGAAAGTVVGGLFAYCGHEAAPTKIPYSVYRQTIPWMAVGAIVGGGIAKRWNMNALPGYFELRPLVREQPTE